MDVGVQLDFHNQIFVELLAEDGLVVLARGLGLEQLFIKFLKLYSDPHSLVLAINTPPSLEAHCRDELLREKVDHLPRAVTNEISRKEREHLYNRGGVLFITSRILVVDLLRKQCPMEQVTGLLVWNAHKVADSTSEAFILRLFRESNKTGFIKAFTDNPEQLVTGFSQLERTMRNLFLRNVYLWPRFHATINASLERCKPDVVELRQQLTPTMTLIQMAILDIMKTCVTELKAANPSLDMGEVTVETCLSKSFDQVVRLQLDPVWNQLGYKTKQLVGDLKTLRTLLYYLTQYDCVTFYHYLDSLRSSSGTTFSGHSNWLFLEATNQLFGSARVRVFGAAVVESSQKGKGQDLRLEENPKWQLLAVVLEELRQEMQGQQMRQKHQQKRQKHQKVGQQCEETEQQGGQQTGQDTQTGQPPGDHTIVQQDQQMGQHDQQMEKEMEQETEEVGEEDKLEREGGGGGGGGDEGEGGGQQRTGHVLVVANDERTCYQLRQYLCCGGCGLLEQQFRRFLSHKHPQYVLGGGAGGGARGGGRKRKRVDQAREGVRRGREEEEGLDAGQHQELAQAELHFVSGGGMRSAPPTQSDHTHFSLLRGPVILLHALNYSDTPHMLGQLLQEHRPRYLVMYDPDVRCVRQLEVYQATHPSSPLRVYFLLYDSSVEEQKYLTVLHREKEAFQQLIRERAHMAVPVDRDGKVADSALLRRNSAHSPQLDHTHSRRAGGQSTVEKVIVDMREFRSSLPSLLHRQGMDIIPLTMEVGDYVLTPDVCVERKSISDLIGSLNSGRLFTQATAMTRHYSRPVLLIEFEDNKPFSLQSLSSLQADISSQSTLSKLVLLTIHFPALRILWCPSPYATAELFQELKKGHAQPDAEQALSVGQDSLGQREGSEYSAVLQDFLLKLPGVSSKNCRFLLDGVCDLQELVSLSQAQLEALLGNDSTASLLYSFLHSSVDQQTNR